MISSVSMPAARCDAEPGTSDGDLLWQRLGRHLAMLLHGKPVRCGCVDAAAVARYPATTQRSAGTRSAPPSNPAARSQATMRIRWRAAARTDCDCSKNRPDFSNAALMSSPEISPLRLGRIVSNADAACCNTGGSFRADSRAQVCKQRREARLFRRSGLNRSRDCQRFEICQRTRGVRICERIERQAQFWSCDIRRNICRRSVVRNYRRRHASAPDPATAGNELSAPPSFGTMASFTPCAVCDTES